MFALCAQPVISCSSFRILLRSPMARIPEEILIDCTPSACAIAMPKKGAKGGDAKGKGGKGKDEPPDVSAQVFAGIYWHS